MESDIGRQDARGYFSVPENYIKPGELSIRSLVKQHKHQHGLDI